MSRAQGILREHDAPASWADSARDKPALKSSRKKQAASRAPRGPKYPDVGEVLNELEAYERQHTADRHVRALAGMSGTTPRPFDAGRVNGTVTVAFETDRHRH
ncbi:hypothetical protein [Streptomyces sp. 7N604]|uniref:hypothetical protein n=1 Tax=Streptomyces sp. 7N604 TaxID=3457415 RepID=UPI003FD611DC